MQGSISMSAASLNDVKALDALLTPIPNNQPLRDALKPGFAGSVDLYHAASRTAHYIRADGKFVVCFILADVTQMEAMAVREELSLVKVPDLHLETFKEVVRSALKVQISGIN